MILPNDIKITPQAVKDHMSKSDKARHKGRMLARVPLLRELYAFQSVRNFGLLTAQLSNLFDEQELLVRSSEEAKSFREAWVTKLVAKALSAQSCRLIRDDFPDAEVRLSDDMLSVEIAELDDPNRRRSDEYRNAQLRITAKDHKAFQRLSELWPSWFVNIVKSKTERYGRSAAGVDLVVHNNLDFYRDLDELPLLGAMLADQIGSPRFRRVWHSRPNALHEIWPIFRSYPIVGWENEIITLRTQ